MSHSYKYLTRTNEELKQIVDQLREVAFPSKSVESVPQKLKDTYEQANSAYEARQTTPISHADRESLKRQLKTLSAKELAERLTVYKQEVAQFDADRDATATPSLVEKRAKAMLSSAEVVNMNKGVRPIL